MRAALLLIALTLVATSAPAMAQVSLNTSGANGGAVVIGESTTACDGTIDGGIRYNTSSNCLELCDGASWSCISVGACADATPDGFDFIDLVNQATSAQVTSNILQITGVGCVVNITIAGEGSPQYQTCSDSSCTTVLQDWTSSGGTVDNNDYVRLRLTTSAAGGDTHSATLSVGNTADVWNATPTGDCTGSPAPGTICADGTVYAGLSPDGNVQMFATRCDAGMSWDGSACSGPRFSLSWNDGNSEWVTTGFTSSITGESNTTGIAATDANGTAGGFQDHVAAVHCNNLSQDGHSDWYLPAEQELNVLYINKDEVANFETSGTRYWSSSELNNVTAWAQRFSDGSQTDSNKNGTFAVRCVRR